MKKKILVIIGALLAFIVVLAVFLIPSRPDGTTDTPELDEVLNFTQEQLEGKLIGLLQEEIYHSWGQPDGHLSGFWGETWNIDNSNRQITLYYDSDGCVENIKIGEIAIQ